MHMKIAVEILLIWTALDVLIGIPLWMLIKLRDRREASAAEKRTDKLSQTLTQALEDGCSTVASADFAQRAFQRGHRRG
jgi:hypothetical protein